MDRVSRPHRSSPLGERSEVIELATHIESKVHLRTGRAIRDLRVEIGSGSVRLHGRCGSFYCKQLAQQAVMDLRQDMLLTNEIEVA